MIIDGASDRVEDRLERLAKLHTDGDLDDNEYRSAKALLLTPALATTDDVATTVRTRGPLAWWVPGLILAVVIGFTLACLSSAFTTLQGPAGPVLCSDGDFLAGNVSERYGGTTSYNIDSACVSATGDVRQLSQVEIIGVLWFVYTGATLVVIAVLIGLARGLRAARRDASDGLVT
jgi:hypothetical protein